MMHLLLAMEEILVEMVIIQSLLTYRDVVYLRNH